MQWAAVGHFEMLRAPSQGPGGELAPFQPPFHIPHLFSVQGLESSTLRAQSHVPTE